MVRQCHLRHQLADHEAHDLLGAEPQCLAELVQAPAAAFRPPSSSEYSVNISGYLKIVCLHHSASKQHCRVDCGLEMEQDVERCSLDLPLQS